MDEDADRPLRGQQVRELVDQAVEHCADLT
jgi:hypothetical protein